ncbi:hypothetical protein [Paenibacillus polymyxa]|uniref:hypothetical protein n=1 Tax=Paenibacillus polymyxa TaxID=1406 RepID=UPI002023C0BC|nr:hypothetical protein [Paenibacillus polymyxa]URJ58039.3 hypothetical protein MF622_002530 [Paenibacillus polymyxa]
MQNQKILIVDDENGIILMLEMALRKEGYTMIRRALTGGGRGLGSRTHYRLTGV